MVPQSYPSELTLPGGPRLRWLEASDRGLDPDDLRRWARDLSAAAADAHVSRSYSFPYALVGWHTDPLGVDLERVSSLPGGFGGSISTPAEQRERAAEESRDRDPAAGGSRDRDRAAGAGRDRNRELTSLWASKEALAKALGDPLAYDPRRLESPRGWAGGFSGPWRARELDAPSGYVAWVVWRAAGSAAR